jgi:hypothetical protein
MKTDTRHNNIRMMMTDDDDSSARLATYLNLQQRAMEQ